MWHLSIQMQRDDRRNKFLKDSKFRNQIYALTDIPNPGRGKNGPIKESYDNEDVGKISQINKNHDQWG